MSPRGKPDPEDVELVRQALAGSQQAYTLIVNRYQRPVFSLIRRMVGESAVAEDVAQDVFIKAFRALESFDQRKKFSSWLFKIAHNSAIDRLRRRQIDMVALETTDSEQPDLVAVIADGSSESPATRVERRDLAAAIEAAIRSLRPEYREVVVLRFQEGLAYEEIAEVVGLPLGTVKTHIFRARKAMVRHLAAHGWSPKAG